MRPALIPSNQPSIRPSIEPNMEPNFEPSIEPSYKLTREPSKQSNLQPTSSPTAIRSTDSFSGPFSITVDKYGVVYFTALDNDGIGRSGIYSLSTGLIQKYVNKILI
jgi:hypothetical protein